jgi:hypothetical protein
MFELLTRESPRSTPCGESSLAFPYVPDGSIAKTSRTSVRHSERVPSVPLRDYGSPSVHIMVGV